MAKVINNSKGFKVIQVKAVELIGVIPHAMGICDYCGQASLDGYYIAVLNSYYCSDCTMIGVKGQNILRKIDHTKKIVLIECLGC